MQLDAFFLKPACTGSVDCLFRRLTNVGFIYKEFVPTSIETRADLGGGSRGCSLPPPPLEMTCGFLLQLVFCKKKIMWFIGVEVEQETSAPPPKKNPGSAPVRYWKERRKVLYYVRKDCNNLLNFHLYFLSTVCQPRDKNIKVWIAAFEIANRLCSKNVNWRFSVLLSMGERISKENN